MRDDFDLCRLFHFVSLCRLVAAWYASCRYCQAVPGIDGGNGKSKISEFLFVEVLSCILVNVIRCMGLADVGYRFGPFERRAFEVSVVRRFLPRVQSVE